jgi:hypothetical protein
MEWGFPSMNRVSSKLVHPTAWSTLAGNVGRSSYPEATDLRFATGIVYISQIYTEVRDFDRARCMLPLP